MECHSDKDWKDLEWWARGATKNVRKVKLFMFLQVTEDQSKRTEENVTTQ